VNGALSLSFFLGRDILHLTTLRRAHSVGLNEGSTRRRGRYPQHTTVTRYRHTLPPLAADLRHRRRSHRGRLACLILTKIHNDTWPSLNFDIIRLAHVPVAVENLETEYAIASVSSSPRCTLCVHP
jgi:hypothetical protein